MFKPKCSIWEHSGLVVEYLTHDLRVAVFKPKCSIWEHSGLVVEYLTHD